MSAMARPSFRNLAVFVAALCSTHTSVADEGGGGASAPVVTPAPQAALRFSAGPDKGVNFEVGEGRFGFGMHAGGLVQLRGGAGFAVGKPSIAGFEVHMARPQIKAHVGDWLHLFFQPELANTPK